MKFWQDLTASACRLEETGSGTAAGCNRWRRSIGNDRNSRPDIILLDLNIPRVSGLEILEFLKKEEMQTRVIVVSCQEEFDVVKKAMKLGAYDYLRKLNLSSDELESILKSVWEKQKKEIRCICREYVRSVMKRL